MHASIEQLLDLRDGNPIDSAVSHHVELCEKCSHELRQLRDRKRALMELPQLAPSPQVFAQMTERLANEQREVRSYSHAGRWAVAATVVMALALWLVPQPIQTPSDQIASLPSDPPNTSTPITAASKPTTAAESHSIDANAAMLRDALLQRSAALEAVSRQLADMGQAGPSSSTDEALNALETQLALVDYNLNAAQIDQYIPDELNALLARRVNTLENIVSVRQAELARQGFHGFQVMTASTIEEDQTW